MINKLLAAGLWVLFLGMPPMFSSGQGDEPARLSVFRVPDLEVTGNGSSPAWENAEWVTIPKRNNDQIHYSTRAKVLWSDTGIYFLFHCEDRVIHSTMQGNNLSLWEEDVVEVFLMPDDKYPLYFEYQLSPLNYELTLLIPNLDGKFLGWLPWNYEGDKMTRHQSVILRKGNQIDGAVEGWMAEFFIPWKLMDPLVKTPPVAGTTWKANMYRLDYDAGTTRFSWSPTVKNFHEPHHFGEFVFKE